jgi:hypothetical protein
MVLDIKQELFSQLAWHWDAQLRPGLGGLTDEEYLWEPAPRCWTVRKVDDRWLPDDGLAPDPPPFTTIAWRLCHICTVLGARSSFHFGDGSWSKESVSWPGTAADALTLLDRCWDAWSTGVEALAAERLTQKSEGPPGTLDGRFPFAQVILHVNREVLHHGAEVACLRDLWRSTRPDDPFVAASLAGDRAVVTRLVSDDPTIVERTRAQHPALILRAVEHGTPEAVRLLADLGFDVNAMTGRAPLHHAAGAGDLELVRLLVDLGADLTLVDPTYTSTPLGWAEYLGQPDVAEYLTTLLPPED